jgi:hypothetical protein
MLELFPILNLVGNEPLGVAAVSYGRTFNVCITADGHAFPDLDVFAAGLRCELEALSVAASAGSALAASTSPRGASSIG